MKVIEAVKGISSCWLGRMLSSTVVETVVIMVIRRPEWRLGWYK